MQEKQDVIKPARDSKGRLLPGNTANPNGRPKGKTLKEFAREWYMLKSDEEKVKYIEEIEKKKPGFAWQMAEGNPSTSQDITSGGEKIEFSISSPIANKNGINTEAGGDS